MALPLSIRRSGPFTRFHQLVEQALGESTRCRNFSNFFFESFGRSATDRVLLDRVRAVR